MTARRLTTGVVSATFRGLDPDTILELARRADLDEVAWSGDVHVPVGDLDTARRVAAATDRAGLAQAAYGSYHRVGVDAPEDFGAVVRTAVTLGAPSIRVWAGASGSAECAPTDRARVVEAMRRAAEEANGAGLRLVLEHHAGTLTDDPASTLSLLHAVDADVATLWQPPVGMDDAGCVGELEMLAPHLDDVHVFHWWPDHEHRRPLAEGAARWRRLVDVLRARGGGHALLLEFVRDDAPDAFLADAATLHDLVQADAA